MILVDSSGWLQYFAEGPLAEAYAKHLEEPEAVLTPTVVLYEVYKKVRRERGEEAALLAAAQMEKTRIASLTAALALLAADLSLECNLPMLDAIVYATARSEGTKVATSDADFRDLPDVVFLEVRQG